MEISFESVTGLRALASLRSRELCALGEEAADLAKVVALGVPLSSSWLVGLSDDTEGQVLAAVSAALDSESNRSLVELRPLYATYALAERCRRLWPTGSSSQLRIDERRLAASPFLAIRRGQDVRARVRELFRVLGSPEMVIALGGARTDMGLRITVRDDVPMCFAVGIDPETGDPDRVAAWNAADGARVVPPVLFDRITMRLIEGVGGEPPKVLSQVADLADRAQLAAGRPLELAFGHQRGRLVLLSANPVRPPARFAPRRHVLVSLLGAPGARPPVAESGAITPLSVDLLDAALRAEAAGEREENRPSQSTHPGAESDRVDPPGAPPPGPGARAERFYARPYRPLGGSGPSAALAPAPRSASIVETASRTAGLGVRITTEIAAARGWLVSLEPTLEALDEEKLEHATSGCLAALERRAVVAIDALARLERARALSEECVAALEQCAGSVPLPSVRALLTIRRTRSRSRAEDRLHRLARALLDELGEVPEGHRLTGPMRRRWDETKAAIGELRPLGLDLAPEPFAIDDRAFRAALVAHQARADDGETERRDALRRALATARQRPLGRAREALATAIGIGLAQLADLRGALADAIAAILLRVRRAAIEVGIYLRDREMLERPEDVLYLSRLEIGRAASGEPESYVARVRRRRDDDARWARYGAPPIIEATAPTRSDR